MFSGSVRRLAMTAARRVIVVNTTRQVAGLLRPTCSQLPLVNARRCKGHEVFYTRPVETQGGLPGPTDRTPKEVQKMVVNAIRTFDRFPKDANIKLTLDTHLMNDLGLDSLDHVEIIMAIEDDFMLEIPDADAERLMTPRSIVQYICDKEDIVE